MEDKKLLLLATLEAQGLAKRYELEVPVLDAFDNDAQKSDIHFQSERSANRGASYYRTTKK